MYIRVKMRVYQTSISNGNGTNSRWLNPDEENSVMKIIKCGIGESHSAISYGFQVILEVNSEILVLIIFIMSTQNLIIVKYIIQIFQVMIILFLQVCLIMKKN